MADFMLILYEISLSNLDPTIFYQTVKIGKNLKFAHILSFSITVVSVGKVLTKYQNFTVLKLLLQHKQHVQVVIIVFTSNI